VSNSAQQSNVTTCNENTGETKNIAFRSLVIHFLSIFFSAKIQWRIQGGNLGQLPRPKPLWRPVEWRPFDINAPTILVPIQVETEIKKYSKPVVLTPRGANTKQYIYFHIHLQPVGLETKE